MLTDTQVSEVLNDLQLLQGAVLVGSILLGMFTLLVISSAYILIYRGISYRPRAIVLSSVAAMYIASIVYWAMIASSLLQIVHNPEGYLSTARHSSLIKSRIMTVCLVFNIWFNNAILLWNICIICCDRMVKLTSIVLLFILSVLEIVFFAFSFKSSSEIESFGVPVLLENPSGFASLLMSLIIHVWVSSLLLARNWSHKGQFVQPTPQNNTADGILGLMLKVVVLHSIIVYATIATSSAEKTSQVQALISSTVQLAGIHPTLVIVFTCLQKLNGSTEVVPSTLSPWLPSFRAVRASTVSATLAGDGAIVDIGSTPEFIAYR